MPPAPVVQLHAAASPSPCCACPPGHFCRAATANRQDAHALRTSAAHCDLPRHIWCRHPGILITAASLPTASLTPQCRPCEQHSATPCPPMPPPPMSEQPCCPSWHHGLPGPSPSLPLAGHPLPAAFQRCPRHAQLPPSFPGAQRCLGFPCLLLSACRGKAGLPHQCRHPPSPSALPPPSAHALAPSPVPSPAFH